MLLGGQNQTWGAVWVWRQPLVSGQLTGIQGDALKRGKRKGRSLPLSAPLEGNCQGFSPSLVADILNTKPKAFHWASLRCNYSQKSILECK